MKTVLEVIQATTAYFQKSGIESPRLNIEHLLAHVLGKKRMELYLEFDRPLSEPELEPLRALVKRRAAGEPLQHLLGTAEFHGRSFLCDKRGLVPRPETEQLCELVLAGGAAKRVLDIGTGSGVIALTLATAWPEAQVEAVDLSPDALALARENAARLELAGRVQFLASDLLASVTGEYDLIVANLPYIARDEIATLTREVRHDPLSALDGGPDGLEVFRRFIPQAAQHLRGRLALEIGHDQADPLTELLAAHNFQDIRPQTDYQGKDRFIFATYG
ncbi:protein-(glutamine-N5) methyltransferase, release factor-specific [Chthoniobacter flavus Ellin428]|uniref:Release factor glutamine methyltransferase n=1 Tax=Chthoniobacter flavus Ellin428 TaxID=497964 RepID=B4CY64_9BACT|nr:peptide chain release factor N(5)-glutamine methyltransferase [Chthoniobacter flavus]EDY21212.1 protein-(glutamine-N5) methyltransferase, release factor-specific [Chthoniobacter flavus Ellin428]TCO87581.1 release factor glutamine methyltransferase [Chthoniobacter flavus]